MIPEFRYSTESLGTGYRKTIAALSSKSTRGYLLLLSTAIVAFGTGVIVLFVDMPLPLIGVLSVVSLATLALFVKGARSCFFPDSEKPGTTVIPDNGKGTKIPAMVVQYLRFVRSMGNRTDRGDVMILGICMVGILTGYFALFIDLPLPILVISGIASLITLGTAGIAAGFRFAPERMTTLLPALTSSHIAQFPSEARHHVGIPHVSGPEIPPAEIPEKSGGGILEVYWVQSPFAYIKIARQGNLGFVYTVVEPVITPREKIILQEAYSYLRDVIIFDNPDKKPEDLLDRETVFRILRENDPTMSDERLPILEYFLRRDLSGFGLLEPLMHDPALEDISCNGENLPVFVFHRTYGSQRTSVLFRRGELNQFVLKLAQKANKQISLTNPMVDAALPDGSRVQVTYSNVISTNGSSFTIRKFRSDPMTPLDLIKFGTYNSEILAFLWLVIEHRRSLIIAGGTASGKTSTMNAISLFIPLNSKIVSLEDTREIQLPHKNWLATQTRELNTPGVQGDVDLFSLLKSSMRQRPEYIIVGEVRGREAQTLFQAMNTGHATLSTIHAGSVQEAINRLTHEPINVPPVMFTALDLVVSQAVFTFGSLRVRRCAAIHEISVDEHGTIIPVKLYEWDTASNRFCKTGARSKVLDEIALIHNWSMEQVTDELRRREEFLNVAVDAPPPDIIDLANAIHDLGE